MDGRLSHNLESISSYPGGIDRVFKKAGLVDERMTGMKLETQAIEQRAKTLEMSVDQLFDENHLLREELAAVREELGATLRSKADIQNNLASTNALLTAERESVRVLRADNCQLTDTTSGFRRDNSAFHNENVDVRVRVVELTEQNTELVAALKVAEAERDDFEGQLKAVAAQYNALAAKLRFATEEYGLKTSPVRVAAGDGRVDLMSTYLRRVAEDHPEAISQAPVPASIPAHPQHRKAPGGSRYLEARSYCDPQYVGWSPTLLRTEGVTMGARPTPGQYVASPYRMSVR